MSGNGPQAGKGGAQKPSADIIAYPRWMDRALEASLAIDADPDAPELTFLHSILAQTVLPLRDPKALTYERVLGRAHLRLTTGQSFDRKTGAYVDSPGLPYGARARLILMHLCREALAQGSAEIEIAESLSGLMQSMGIRVTGGKNGSIAGFKSQLHRLATAQISLNFTDQDAGQGTGSMLEQVNPHALFSSYTLWFPDGMGKGLQGSTVRFSEGFFDDLQKHAVPLDMRAIQAISDSARALDVYAWLAYRLHRVRNPRGERITWRALQAQFGTPGGDNKSFKRAFRMALARAQGVYANAQTAVTIVDDGRRSGLHIERADPPVRFRPSAAKRVNGPKP